MSKQKFSVPRRVLMGIAIAILAGVFLFSAFQLGKYAIESMQSKSTYDSLAQIMDEKKPSRPSIPLPSPTGDGSEPATLPTETEPEYVTVTHPTTGEQMMILPEFEELFQLNPNLVGWIEVPETRINYPVVQTPNSRDYYLRRDYYGNYDTHGCIYAREQCDVFRPTDNITIYGHRMQDGSMFADLIKYASKDFYDQNPYIYFDTLTERHTYQVMAVFKTTATVGEGFRYHAFVDAANAEEFSQFVDTCKSLAFYNTGVGAKYGDKLITLSTCEYSQENGRLVVVAKRII